MVLQLAVVDDCYPEPCEGRGRLTDASTPCSPTPASTPQPVASQNSTAEPADPADTEATDLVGRLLVRGPDKSWMMAQVEGLRMAIAVSASAAFSSSSSARYAEEDVRVHAICAGDGRNCTRVTWAGEASGRRLRVQGVWQVGARGAIAAKQGRAREEVGLWAEGADVDVAWRSVVAADGAWPVKTERRRGSGSDGVLAVFRLVAVARPLQLRLHAFIAQGNFSREVAAQLAAVSGGLGAGVTTVACEMQSWNFAGQIAAPPDLDTAAASAAGQGAGQEAVLVGVLVVLAIAGAVVVLAAAAARRASAASGTRKAGLLGEERTRPAFCFMRDAECVHKFSVCPDVCFASVASRLRLLHLRWRRPCASAAAAAAGAVGPLGCSVPHQNPSSHPHLVRAYRAAVACW